MIDRWPCLFTGGRESKTKSVRLSMGSGFGWLVVVHRDGYLEKKLSCGNGGWRNDMRGAFFLKKTIYDLTSPLEV